MKSKVAEYDNSFKIVNTLLSMFVMANVDNKNGYKVTNIDNIHENILDLIKLNLSQRKRISISSINFAKKFTSKYIFNKWDKFISG